MEMIEYVKLVTAFIVSIGGSSVVIIALSKWFGNFLSTRLLDAYNNKHEKELEVIKTKYASELENTKNVFGRRQDPNSTYAAVIPLFIKQYLNHQQPKINGDGLNTRDFTYIDNVIHMNMLALNSSNQSSINQIYNTAGGEQTSINQLDYLIKDVLSQYDPFISSVDPIYGPNRIGDIQHSFACIDKAKLLLGYNPLVSFKEGLIKTIEWYVNNHI